MFLDNGCVSLHANENRSYTHFRTFVQRLTCPTFVNLIPFESKFKKICLSLSGSPITCVLVEGFMYAHISRPFPRALEATESTASSIT